MKKNVSSILMIGRDEHLLATRQWVLQTRGYQVLTVARPVDIRKVPVTLPVRLIVLCHTLSDTERRAVTAIAGSRWRGVKILTLSAELERTPSGILGQLLHTMDGPDRLVSMVSELVGSSAELGTARLP